MKKLLFILLPAILLLSACDKQKDLRDYPPAEPTDDSGTFQPIDDSGQFVRFYLQVSPDDIRAKIGGDKHVFSASDSIYSRSVNYVPKFEGDRPYLDVPSSKDHNYNMFCYPFADKGWYVDEAPISGLMFPYAQIYEMTIDRMSTFPMYGVYSEATGNTMMFNEVYSVLDLVVKGEGNVASVHVLNKTQDPNNVVYMAGWSEYDPDRGYVVKEGVNFVNLNCTNNGSGVALSPAGTHFYLVVAPGDYNSGFEVTVTDMDHKGQVFNIPGANVSSGKIATLTELNYSPDPSLVLFEHFDNFVWGACVRNPYGVQASYAPDAKTNLNDDPTARKGYEEAITAVANTTDGSAIFQTTYTDGYTVDKRAAVSKEYLVSRNLNDYLYLYRCSENQGCMCCGANDGVRALINLYSFNKDEYKKGLTRVVLDFDISLRYSSQDAIQFSVTQGGIVSRVVIDNTELELENSYVGNNTYTHSFTNACTVKREDLPAPQSIGDEDGWHHVTVTIDNVCEPSSFRIQGASTESSIKHGFYIDNLEIRKMEQPKGNLRVLYWNIQDGMWADQEGATPGHGTTGFNNFVDWVKKWNPDVCIWCESRSVYKTDSYSSMLDEERYLNKTEGATSDVGWTELASRYGHPNVAISGFCDNYPQVVTTRAGLPISVVSRMVQSGKSPNITGPMHGAGHFTITVGGQKINIVTLHLWPQIFSPNNRTDAGAIALEGRDYQVHEINCVMDNTIKKYPGEKYWIMAGDHNAISTEDRDYYEINDYYSTVNRELPGGGTYTWPKGVYREKWYIAITEILNSGKYKDLIYTTYPCKMMTSTYGTGRIDYMWASPDMYAKKVNTLTVRDTFVGTSYNKTYTGGSLAVPSDHRPIMTDFQL